MRLFAVCLMLVAPLAFARADCMRNCATTLKNFEKQCKETAAQAKTGSNAGCDMVLKKAEQACKQQCATGERPKKHNSGSF
jgi:hypothetical protein